MKESPNSIFYGEIGVTANLHEFRIKNFELDFLKI